MRDTCQSYPYTTKNNDRKPKKKATKQRKVEQDRMEYLRCEHSECPVEFIILRKRSHLCSYVSSTEKHHHPLLKDKKYGISIETKKVMMQS